MGLKPPFEEHLCVKINIRAPRIPYVKFAVSVGNSPLAALPTFLIHDTAGSLCPLA